MPNAFEEEIARLRRRAVLLKVQSYFILLLIVGTIGGGSYLFYFAGQIAEQTIEGVSDDLRRVTDRMLEDSNLLRTTITEKQVTFDAASQALEMSTERLVETARGLDAKLSELESRVAVVETQTANLRAVDMEEISRRLDEKLNAASREVLEASDTVAASLEEIWEQGPALPNNCTFANELDQNDLLAVKCVAPYQEELSQSFADCTVSYRNDGSGAQHRIFRCADSVFRSPPNVKSAFPAFLEPLDNFRVLANEFDGLTVDEIALDFELEDEFAVAKANFEDISTDIARFVEETNIEAPKLDTSTLAQLEILANTLADASASMVGVAGADSSGEPNWYSFIDQVTVRVTVVVLIIFLVQILVNLFRYGTRLSAFYDARADALVLIGRSGRSVTSSEFSSLVMSLAPDSLDFGRSAKTPLDSAVELSRQILLVGKSQA